MWMVVPLPQAVRFVRVNRTDLYRSNHRHRLSPTDRKLIRRGGQLLHLSVSAVKKQLPDYETGEPVLGAKKSSSPKENDEDYDSGWLPAFPHVAVSSMANFLFGYHIGLTSWTKYSLEDSLWAWVLELTRLWFPFTSQRWRTMLYAASVPGFFLALGMQFAVDSPRWLCKVGRLDDAKAVIRNLWGKREVEKTIEEFQAVMKNDCRKSGGWFEVLEEPHYRATFVGGALFLLQQFAGINGILYFSSLTFKDVGITSSATASLLVGLTNFAGALCASYLIDREGRKKLLIGSYLGMASSMLLFVYSINFPPTEELGHNLSILGTLMYIFTFAIGAGPMTGLIIPELSSNRTRSRIMALSFSVHWVCNFLLGLFFLDLVEKFGVDTIYAGFGCVSVLAAIFANNMIIETKGRSLEEIGMSFNSKFLSK